MKVFQFFSEVKAELGKVVWPTKSETARYAISVIVLSVVVALILGLADFGILTLFEKVI